MTDAPPVTHAEDHRRHMHTAVDRIVDAWPHARVDADARGFPAGRSDGEGRGSVGDHSDPTASIAMTKDRSVAWLAELHDTVVDLHAAAGAQGRIDWRPELVRQAGHRWAETVCAAWPAHAKTRERVYRLADAAARWWPPAPKKGDTVEGVTVGGRTNSTEVCKLCQMPVTGARNDKIRRIDGDPYHRYPCWWALFSDRQGRPAPDWGTKGA